MKWLRSVLAIAAGGAILGATRIGGQDRFLPALAAIVAGALLAGFLAAWIAGSQELSHASALGVAMVVLAFVSMREKALARPGWYELTVGGCGPIAALVGGAIRLLTKRQGI